MAVWKPGFVAAIGGFALACAASAALIGCSGEKKPANGPGASSGPPAAQGAGGARGGRGAATEVIVVPVSVRDFAMHIVALGTLEPRERVDLTANAAERVTNVYFEDGQRVRAGATLILLQQEEEHALLEASQASQADAQRIFERNQRLAKDGAISSKDLDTSRALAESTSANVRSLQARIRDRVIVAPFSGVLGFRKVSTGAFVSPGQVVATLIDDSEMRLEFSVPSIYITELKRGLKIQASTKDLPGKSFEGSVTSIDNAIDPVTRSVKVRATLPNHKGELKAGMFMDVEVLAKTHTSLSIPEIAVVAEGEDTFAFVVERAQRPPGGEGAGAPPAGASNGGPGAAPSGPGAGPGGAPGGGGPRLVAHKKPIRVGVREKGLVEVVEGLQEGDRVVTDGILKVRPNAPVVVKASAADEGGGPRVAESDTPADKSSLRQ